jgi:hypothetical protein
MQQRRRLVHYVYPNWGDKVVFALLLIVAILFSLVNTIISIMRHGGGELERPQEP